MEVSYGEGVATHTGPESCATGRKVRGEALTGVRAGRVSSREIDGKLRGADALDSSATFRIEVALSPERLARGTLSGSIWVATSDPKIPEIVIPVHGRAL